MTRPVHVNIKMTRREVPKFMVVHTHTHTHTHFYLLVKKISTLLILIFVADCVPHIYMFYMCIQNILFFLATMYVVARYTLYCACEMWCASFVRLHTHMYIETYRYIFLHTKHNKIQWHVFREHGFWTD